MDTSTVILLMILAGLCFLAYLLYTRQVKWVFNLLRNGVIGCACILAANYLLAFSGITVGVNLLSAFVVGILGIPGFFLLYITQFMIT